MEADEIARRARAAGLEHYMRQYPDQLASALEAAAALSARLPRDLKPADEPAHALRLAPVEGKP